VFGVRKANKVTRLMPIPGTQINGPVELSLVSR